MTFKTVTNGKNMNYKTNDDIMTPNHIAKYIIEKLPINENDFLYDPFRGGGAFYDNFPARNKKSWSEIKEGEDFFDFNEKVDWIISNPPYSKYTEVMQHSYDIADNIVYLIPLNKIVSSWGRCIDLKKLWRSIKNMDNSSKQMRFSFWISSLFCMD